jgi:hypothetical protein
MVKEKQQVQAARGKKGKKKGDSTSHAHTTRLYQHPTQ